MIVVLHQFDASSRAEKGERGGERASNAGHCTAPQQHRQSHHRASRGRTRLLNAGLDAHVPLVFVDTNAFTPCGSRPHPVERR
jgi:hypothetical protein